MNTKPNFTTMTSDELRAYVLTHRQDQQALQLYIDKCQAENPDAPWHTPEDDSAEAIAIYLEHRQSKNESA
jgi:hypothetical protein